MDIIDRRSNPHGKNLENRQRVINRARAAVTKAARSAIDKGTIREIGNGEAVTVPADVLHEPSLHTVFTGGQRTFVLSGNKEFSTGDRLKRPSGRGSGGPGGEGSGQGEGQDDFRFVLSRDEFLDLFFEDLELPDLVKNQVTVTESAAPVRAGISTDGAPSRIDMSRTMRRSMARRIGLRRPKTPDLRELEEEIARCDAEGDKARADGLRVELEAALRKLARVPWLDPIDMRYRRFQSVPKPAARAVMFCLMDVSGSMSETMKDIAKRFFLLLHVFLERRYKRVELVFIRHTEVAEEVDEEAFFTDPRTGGTVVSTALAELARIQRERYPSDSWNIYAAQASDGDNSGNDTRRATAMLESDILPVVQYFAYIEIAMSAAIIRGTTDLWAGYSQLAERAPKLAMRRVSDRRDIFPVFRDLFARTGAS